ncbi:MAG: hypothetical protein HC925_01830 [Coleofasciculaceae cyanobacterium SM2_3_26]|nr:hypothetical protein [Coleofasciculaceae cyanobacterium SM2_3_26]
MQDASSDFQASITEEVVGSPRYLRLQFKLDRELTGKVLNDDSDDATPENISNLIEAAQVYINKPDIQEALAKFLAANQ